MNDDSSPCFAHKLVAGHVVDPQTAHDVAVFRNAERKRLYVLRLEQSLETRKWAAEKIAERLDVLLGCVSGKTIALYWPIRGEPDLRNWMAKASADGATIGLPVVVKKDNPVEFHQWTPDCPMKRGFWKIPVPADEVQVTPDVVIVPLLGVDKNKYRLGNGGGYYDRTLALLPEDAEIIGVGQAFTQMETIFPMPWDIAMKQVILV